jgi:hypothetical protein
VSETHDLRGTLAVIVVGISAMVLGCKGFTLQGLPWSKRRNITGKWAEVLGVICVLIGAAFIWGFAG